MVNGMPRRRFECIDHTRLPWACDLSVDGCFSAQDHAVGVLLAARSRVESNKARSTTRRRDSGPRPDDFMQ